MDILTQDNIKQLTKISTDNCVSLYMPTHPADPNHEQDQIRLKNLAGQAAERVSQNDKGLAGRIKAKTDALLWDNDFWRSVSQGLAVFISADSFFVYHLPLTFEELVTVSRRFHIKPLLPLLSGNSRFYILALSQNEVQLFHASQYRITPVEIEGYPGGIEEALFDETESQLQFHAQEASGGGERSLIFHGQGVGKDDTKDQILRYFRRIDRVVDATLPDEQAPIVLAGVDFLLPIYREASDYPNLLTEGISGSPTEFSLQKLHTQAWRIVASVFEKEQQEARKRYGNLVGTGRAANDILQIVPAAHHGRVDTLFVVTGVQRWGVYDWQNAQAVQHDQPRVESEDLLDLAAAQTLLNGGKVYAGGPEIVPDETEAAALFRY